MDIKFWKHEKQLNEIQNKEYKEWEHETDDESKAKWFCKIGFIRDSKDGSPRDIKFFRKSGLTHIGDNDAEKLLHLINAASLRIKVAFNDDKVNRENLFKRLISFAFVGLYGESPAPKIALIDFETFKSEVPITTDQVRKRFLTRTVGVNSVAIALALYVLILWLPMHSAVFSNLSVVMEKCSIKHDSTDKQESLDRICTHGTASNGVWLAKYVFPDWNSAQNEQDHRAKIVRNFSNLILAFTMATIGVSLGLILIAFLRNREITYENFDQIYLYRMHPARYFILIEVLAIVFMILVASNILVVGLGSVRLNDIVNNWPIGLILGLLCSISEPLVSGMVISRVRPVEVPEKP